MMNKPTPITVLLDPRSGSEALKPFLTALGARVDMSQQIPADVAFVGDGPDGLIGIGIEHKSAVTGDIFDSLTDGRLSGTQLPRMREFYGRNYLLIEGPTRITNAGTVEVSPKAGLWVPAKGRRVKGWSAAEYWGRLQSLSEFWGVQIKETNSKKESAQWIVELARWWSKPYTEHSSYATRDTSRDLPSTAAARSNPFGLSFAHASKDLPPAQQIAERIPGIGTGYSGYVAKYLRTPAELVLADEESWRRIELLQKLKGRPGYRTIHFSKERIEKIRRWLWDLPGTNDHDHETVGCSEVT